MNEPARTLVSLLVLFVAAKLGEEAAARLHQPGLVGQIIAGFIVGPGVLHWVVGSPSIDFMAQIGVIFLLFESGLATQPEELTEHGYVASAVGTLGVLLPLLVGWGFARAMGENAITARFVGTLLVATSIGITAKVLTDFGALGSTFGRVILGAAVLDDILGLLALSTLMSFTTARHNWVNLLLTVVFVAAFFALVLGLRGRAARHLASRVGSLRTAAPQWSYALVLLLAFSAMAALIGMAAIVGAFLAGLFMSEGGDAATVRLRADAVGSFVTPFFLANIGLRLSPAVLLERHALELLAALTAIAVLTKLVACGLAALPLGRRTALLVGLGMIPRGEVGIVVANQSLRIAAIPTSYYSIGVGMTVLTSIIGPLLLRSVLRPGRAAPAAQT